MIPADIASLVIYVSVAATLSLRVLCCYTAVLLFRHQYFATSTTAACCFLTGIQCIVEAKIDQTQTSSWYEYTLVFSTASFGIKIITLALKNILVLTRCFCFLPCLQAYNGSPCFEAESGRKVCLHIHIVALAVKVSGHGGAAAGTGTATSLDGDYREDDIFASALSEFQNDSPSFARNMSLLMKISAVYLLPRDPLPHLPRAKDLLAERFTCFEKTCTRCGARYEEMAHQSAEAVTQVRLGYLVVLLESLRNTVVLWSAR